MKRWSGLLVLMLCASLAVAANSREEVRKQVEASILVQGTIDIGPQGQVVEYRLEQAASLTPAVFAFVDQRIRAWHFEPVLVEGKAVRARSPIQLRLVRKKDGENYQFRIAGATFGSVDEEGESPTRNGTLKPRGIRRARLCMGSVARSTWFCALVAMVRWKKPSPSR